MITPGRSLRQSLTLRLLILALAGTAVLFTAALSYSQRAADAAYDQVLAGAALAIAEAVTVVDGAIEVGTRLLQCSGLRSSKLLRRFRRVNGACRVLEAFSRTSYAPGAHFIIRVGGERC